MASLASLFVVQPWFMYTSPWLYKALHFSLLISSFRNQAVLTTAWQALRRAIPVVLLVCILPSLVHPVQCRAKTTSLIVQILLMMTLLAVTLHYADNTQHTDAAPLILQLLSGHLFYSLTAACINDRELLLYSPFAIVVFGGSAFVFPLLASLLGPRPAEAEGFVLLGCLCVGEVLGVVVFILSVCLRFAGKAYEDLVRMIVG